METVHVYEFEELDEEAQENALAWGERVMNETFNPVPLTEYFEEQLAARGFPTDVEWSLGYCQGDGVAFYGTVDVEKYLRWKKRWSHYRRIRDGVSAELSKNSFGWHYSHYNTMDVGVDHETLPIGMYSEPDDPMLVEFQKELEEDVRSMSRKLEREGYTWIEQETSEASVREYLIANEYLFTESGRRFFG